MKIDIFNSKKIEDFLDPKIQNLEGFFWYLNFKMGGKI